MPSKKKSFEPLYAEKMVKTFEEMKPKAEFKTVALPVEAYNQAKEMAEREQRSIARQISVIVNQAYSA
ncbi:MAG: hypothetical protein CMF74_12810 [Maricaulis sp.]|jgi:hypothetical protein|nr:hypothetical protein [Maricaulis sp.]|tara:strand:- start:462 stop:665 length:204 start_codon:yes stop_codon:yes gene_type:complete